jgi:hypothetical protein
VARSQGSLLSGIFLELLREATGKLAVPVVCRSTCKLEYLVNSKGIALPHEGTPCILQCTINSFFFCLFFSTPFSIYPEMSSLVPILHLRYLWSAKVNIQFLMCHTNPLCTHPTFPASFSNIYFNIILPSSYRHRNLSRLLYRVRQKNLTIFKLK